MTVFLLILQFCIAVALIGIILIQRSEGGGLGVGNSQGMGAFMSSRGTANLLTRTTAILAGLFMLLSLILAVLYKGGTSGGGFGAAQDILSQTSHTTTALPAIQQTATKILSPAPAVTHPVPSLSLQAPPIQDQPLKVPPRHTQSLREETVTPTHRPTHP